MPTPRAPLVVAYDHLFLVALSQCLRIEFKYVLVLTTDEVLMHRDVGCEQPAATDSVFALDLPVESVYPTARTNHFSHYAVAFVLRKVVTLPRVDVASARSDLPFFAQMAPRKYAAKRPFALLVDVFAVGAMVYREHRHTPFRIEIPCLQPEAVAATGIVVYLLQYMKIPKTTRICCVRWDNRYL